MSNHSLVAPDPGAGIDAQRPGATLSGKHLRKGASAVLAGVLTLGLALGGSSVAAQAAVGGGGSGGGGTGSGTGAADYWLFTGDNYDGYNTPDQGWGNASIDYFANAMEQQGSWPYGDRSHMDTACGNAIDQAIARSNGASTRARVVQVGTGVNQYDGYTVMAWGGTQSGMTSWYNGLTSDNYWQPYLVGYDASVLDDVHDTFVSNIPSSNPRVVCVALNETEGAPRDYTLSLSTDKSAVFSVAGWGEVLRGVEFHALAQVEGVLESVVGDVPFCCQARFDVGATALELGEAVEDGFGGGVEVGAAGVLAGVETCGAGFGAVDQCCGCVCQGGGCGQGQGDQERFEGGSWHGVPGGMEVVLG